MKNSASPTDRFAKLGRGEQHFVLSVACRPPMTLIAETGRRPEQILPAPGTRAGDEGNSICLTRVSGIGDSWGVL